MAGAGEMASGHAVALREARLPLRDQRRASSHDPCGRMGRPAGAPAVSLRAHSRNNRSGTDDAGERAQPAQVFCEGALTPRTMNDVPAAPRGGLRWARSAFPLQQAVVVLLG